MALASSASCCILLTLFAMLRSVESCVYLYGNLDEAAVMAGGHYDYGFVGNDWPSKPSFPTCAGDRQSPINVPKSERLEEVPRRQSTRINWGPLTSNGSDIVLRNNGHTVQVSWPGLANPPTVEITVSADTATALALDAIDPPAQTQRVLATGVQFHFHTHSEHLISGHTYPLEFHMVSIVPSSVLPSCGSGCYVVVGVMFEIIEDLGADNPFLKQIFDIMPLAEGGVVTAPAGWTIDLSSIIAPNPPYATYKGSLTTPPCSEQILWHVVTQRQRISQAQMDRFMMAVGQTQCEEQLPDNFFPYYVVDPARPNPDTNKTEVCYKLGLGVNYRNIQPINGRTIKYSPGH